MAAAVRRALPARVGPACSFRTRPPPALIRDDVPVATVVGLVAEGLTTSEIVALPSGGGMSIEQIFRLVSHSGTSVTELVYWKQIQTGRLRTRRRPWTGRSLRRGRAHGERLGRRGKRGRVDGAAAAGRRREGPSGYRMSPSVQDQRLAANPKLTRRSRKQSRGKRQ